jgi:hypothetical protein
MCLLQTLQYIELRACVSKSMLLVQRVIHFLLPYEPTYDLKTL